MPVLPYTITSQTVTVISNGKSITVREGTPNFILLREALLNSDWDTALKHLTVKTSISEWVKGVFSVSENDDICYKGSPLPESLISRINEMASEGKSPQPLLNFWQKLQNNPSYRSVEQLWNFLSLKGIPISDDGCFLGYKAVNKDYKDFHTDTFNNRPGTINEMPRNKVSDDQNVECDAGFHIGSLDYALSFNGGTEKIIVICKIDPADVVSVPKHDQRKLRVCKYEVIGINNGVLLPSTSVSLTKDNEFKDEGVVEKEEPSKEEFSQIFSKIQNMNLTELMEQKIDVLRKYASSVLHIVGASKIPGGKVSLVGKILKTKL